MRSTRTVEPESSSGLRRKRWRRAGAAMRRRCGTPTALAPSRAASARGAHQRQVTAQAVGAQRHAQRGRALAHRIGHGHRFNGFACPDDLLADALVLGGPLRGKGLWIALVRVAAAHHLHTHRQIVGCLHLHRQAKAVEQLRAQFALLRVTAAHKHKARGVTDGQALALDHVLAAGGHVDQQVHQMVFQQVDFIDVEKAAVRARQQAGLEGLDAL